ncbi:MAG: transcriptional regulator [Arcobacter sp.]|nr:MAG: transcriptional regulator [Arcobacter sp.]
MKLTSLENSLLFLLSKKKSRVVSYEEIFLSLDPFNKMTKVTLKSLIFRLNKKLCNIIKCESMQGYYLKKA